MFLKWTLSAQTGQTVQSDIAGCCLIAEVCGSLIEPVYSCTTARMPHFGQPTPCLNPSKGPNRSVFTLYTTLLMPNTPSPPTFPASFHPSDLS